MDIYSAVYPVNCVSRVLGLTTFMIVGGSGSRSFNDSKILTYYNVSIITFLAVLGLVKLALFVQNPDHSFFRTVRAFEFTAIVITNLILRLACLLQRNKFKLFYKTLSKIDKQIPNINQTYKKVFWRLICVLTVNFILLSFYFIFRCQLYLANNRGLFSSIVGCLIMVTSGCTNHALIIDFTCSVHIIVQRLRALRMIVDNSVLQELAYSTSTNSSQTRVSTETTAPLSSLKTKLQIILELHGLLCDSSSVLSSAFSVQVLFIVGFSFVTVTYSSYFCVISLLHQNKGGFDGAGWNLIAFYWLMLTFTSNTAFLAACDSATQEVMI